MAVACSMVSAFGLILELGDSMFATSCLRGLEYSLENEAQNLVP